MKKSFITLAAVLAASIFFASCASIPEPSSKNGNLVYGNVEFYFQNYPGAKDKLPATDNSTKKVTVEIMNRDSYKFYTAKCLKNGEFSFANIPQGHYMLKQINKSYPAGLYQVIFSSNLETSDTPYYFDVHNDTVINLGTLSYSIEAKSETTFENGLQYAFGYPEAMSTFQQYHSDSKWCLADWINATDTITSSVDSTPEASVAAPAPLANE